MVWKRTSFIAATQSHKKMKLETELRQVKMVYYFTLELYDHLDYCVGRLERILR